MTKRVPMPDHRACPACRRTWAHGEVVAVGAAVDAREAERQRCAAIAKMVEVRFPKGPGREAARWIWDEIVGKGEVKSDVA